LVPPSRVNKSKKKAVFLLGLSWLLKAGRIRRPETSIQSCHSSLRNIPEERRSYSCPTSSFLLLLRLLLLCLILLHLILLLRIYIPVKREISCAYLSV
jgi:hypothetical protein